MARAVARGNSTEVCRIVRSHGRYGEDLERAKVKHLTGTDQIFEFKVEADRVLCFFFVGKRLILTHGFRKTGDKTPKGEIERAEGYKMEFEMRGRT